MTNLTWVSNDGGRRKSGFKRKGRDCVCRAIAIVTGMAYQSVYDDLTERAEFYAARHNNKSSRGIKKFGSKPCTGVHKEIYEPYLAELGWQYVSFGRKRGQLADIPAGNDCLIRYAKHLTALKAGEIHDNHDPRYTYFYGDKRERKVLGYFFRASVLKQNAAQKELEI